MPLLHVANLIDPDAVRWDEVYQEPTSIYQCAENGNYLCSLVTLLLGLSAVGIGGKDIADGTLKLILALVWQLMRLHTLLFLRELGVDEAGIVEWANKQERRGPSNGWYVMSSEY